MLIKFYGTRGSTPVSGWEYNEFGGNTTCVCITFDSGDIMILDAGSGLRALGADLIQRKHQQFENIYIGITHTHWDHIQGFPFFKPAFDKRRTFTFSPMLNNGKFKTMKSVFAEQMQSQYFPIPMEAMGANFRFQDEGQSCLVFDGVHVTIQEHNHPGGAISIKVQENGKTFVFSTDVEHGKSIDQSLVEFCANADFLVHDAQYTPDELEEKRGWGHSSWLQAVEVGNMASVKKLGLTHHDPERTDSMLFAIEAEAQRHFPNSFFARDFQEVEL